MDDKTPEEPGGPAVLAENIKAIVLRHIAGPRYLTIRAQKRGNFSVRSKKVYNLRMDSNRFQFVEATLYLAIF